MLGSHDKVIVPPLLSAVTDKLVVAVNVKDPPVEVEMATITFPTLTVKEFATAPALIVKLTPGELSVTVVSVVNDAAYTIPATTIPIIPTDSMTERQRQSGRLNKVSSALISLLAEVWLRGRYDHNATRGVHVIKLRRHASIADFNATDGIYGTDANCR